MGPTAEGKYHEIIAHGVSPVTGQFPMFEFEKINQEVVKAGLVSPSTPLPRQVGGTPVQLLIGIMLQPSRNYCTKWIMDLEFTSRRFLTSLALGSAMAELMSHCQSR